MPVHLIHDPYSLYSGEAFSVDAPEQLLRTFRDIDDLLALSDGGTQETVAYRVSSTLWPLFSSYTRISDVEIKEYLPRKLLEQRCGQRPPAWLTDELVLRTRLLGRQPGALTAGRWDRTLAQWLLPSACEQEDYGAWLRDVFEAPGADIEKLPENVTDIFWQAFLDKAPNSLSTAELEILRTLWTELPTPKAFVRNALLGPAVAALQTLAPVDYAEFAEEVGGVQAFNRMPLVFPLPAPLHVEVSKRFAQALRTARNDRRSLTRTVLVLNAVWDGVVDELRRWLEVQPGALTEKAASHLASLPGADAPRLRQLLKWFAPVPAPPEWISLHSLPDWISAYSHYLRSAFCRRALPDSWNADPAAHFSDWITRNITVSYNHDEYGFSTVARQVHQHLKQQRPVILVLIDALAFHLVDTLAEEFSSVLSGGPSSVQPIFVPIPTLTEVAKTSVLTGMRPDQCAGAVEDLVRQVYKLEASEVLFVESWHDPSRAQPRAEHKLLVYRENGLDQRLPELHSYVDLLKTFRTVARRVADLVGAWSRDLAHHRRVEPVVIVTGDHGFTYGPPADPDGETAASLGGVRRCVAVDRDKPRSEFGGSVVHLDRHEFFLDKDYIAATSRRFGSGTLSGWALQHGGLLPEEVIVPVLAWYGEADTPVPPSVTPAGEAVREGEQWQFMLRVQNTAPVPMESVQLSVSTPVGGDRFTKQLGRLEPGQHVSVTVRLKAPDIPESEKLPIYARVALLTRSGRMSEPFSTELQIQRKVQLTERTREQSDFEDMFS